MAIPWLLALKVIPWATILAKAPSIAQAAETFLSGARARQGVPPAASEMQRLTERIANLERHDQAGADLLRQLAAQGEALAKATEVLAARQRWLLTLAIVSTVAAVIALVFAAVVGAR